MSRQLPQVAILPWRDAVLVLHGPEPMQEIMEALQKLLAH